MGNRKIVQDTIIQRAYLKCFTVLTGNPLNKDEWTLASLSFTNCAIILLPLMRISIGRRDHQYRQLRADKDYTRFSFFPRTVIQWNQLDIPNQICLSESLDTFKTQVAKIEHPRLDKSSSISSISLPSVFFSSFSLFLSLLF